MFPRGIYTETPPLDESNDGAKLGRKNQKKLPFLRNSTQNLRKIYANSKMIKKFYGKSILSVFTIGFISIRIAKFFNNFKFLSNLLRANNSTLFFLSF